MYNDGAVMKKKKTIFLSFKLNIKYFANDNTFCMMHVRIYLLEMANVKCNSSKRTHLGKKLVPIHMTCV